MLVDAMPPDHPKVMPRKVGVLLLNLGTPDATDYWSMRRYLKEFLSDRRVIEVNRALWWVILNLIILSVRPRKSGHGYDKIWDREAGDSPPCTTRPACLWGGREKPVRGRSQGRLRQPGTAKRCRLECR